ncbi:MAG: restriction endonuclease subunit S [gamma proteobacterium endosymbiont of Lamellibrachia anaximandri]|nr:restriction endonuclease subunit S [gamma proteobacterium endosymbiont of Lamellibrachia anaximandri]MBL3533087.1 restriction endonuclease subunit S [gamma proteobacterium endosymbiont of Lamellibrachia anaximandri]
MSSIDTGLHYPIDLESLPQSWACDLVGRVCDVVQSGFACGKHSDNDIGITHLRPMNVSRDGTIDLAIKKFVPASHDDRRLNKGDVLFNNTNSPELIGKTAYVTKEADGLAFSNHMTRVDFNRLIDAKYGAYQLHYLWMARYYMHKCVKHVNQASISSRDFSKSIPFVVPPTNEQHRIVAKIEELFSELDKGIDSLKTAREQLKVYRQALLKHAFEGKLTEQWRAEQGCSSAARGQESEAAKDNADTAQGGASVAGGQEPGATKLETADDVQGSTNAAGAGSAGAAKLLERIKQEREARYQQQLEEWKAAVKQWEADGKEAKKPSKPQKHKTVDGISSEEYSRLPGVPKEWGYIRFGEVIDTIDAGKSFKCDEREPLDSEVGVAKVSAVTWGEYDQSESKTCLDPEKVVSEYFIREGDFIMSRANTIELVGAAVIVRHVSKSVMLSDKTLRISMDNSLKPFALHYLRSRTGRKEIMSRSTGNQESMRNIGQDRIRSICLPICSEIEIGKIIDLLDEKLSVVDEQIQNIDASLSKSETLRQSILKKAFSGQLVPQDPDDEPATILLERIAKEKEEAAAKAKKAKAAKKKTAKEKKAL